MRRHKRRRSSRQAHTAQKSRLAEAAGSTADYDTKV